MKKPATKIAIGLFTIAMILFIGCKKTDLLSNSDKDYEYLPQDVKQSCIVTDAEFKTWFKGGTVTENGLVEPANSVTFPHNNNCDFYKWSEQMFLWITSPTSSGVYKSGGTVMESPVFYNVSAADSKGARVLIPHGPNTIMSAVSNIVQTGPNRLPIVFDKNRKMFEVESLKSNEAVKNADNKSVVVSSIVTDAKGLHSFIDIKGKVISSPKAIIDSKINPGNVLQEFKTKENKTIFLDSKGHEIDTEQGQAGSHGALIATNKSLVYYITMVNDVYAYFLTGVNERKLNGNQFPTTASALDSILAYAKMKGLAPPPDPNALAIELKTSWVEAKDLPNPESYVTIKAKIPTYNKSNPLAWVVNGETTTTLALVGMHVVGSTAGHPEMIWATFEHEKNSPNSEYSYIDKEDKIKQVKADKGKGWLFNVNADDTINNTQNMTVKNNTIIITDSLHPESIYKPDVRRIMAWGVASNTQPNAEDKTPAGSNSEIISINNAVRKMLVGKDIRKNYLLIGATWTSGGTAPNGKTYPYGAPTKGVPNGEAIGTGQLSNSTMETFVQSGSTVTNDSTAISCFSCHHRNNGLLPGDLSHVFDSIMPLAINKRNLLKIK
ncbi:hypothetical protein LNQ49_09510 [Flavobacterium sp. F-65]|uniref:Uncharacterized protein n=1 Tax=Flavobacterium pisciphilum TaxID=2893755 RepID=A0ABS8MUF9_9FLAO|nr:hypothetical protein [Flavobacterium sp. F-65]MCC9071816.1 hypothetical protein [Flavobacterium sp. F-65]